MSQIYVSNDLKFSKKTELIYFGSDANSLYKSSRVKHSSAYSANDIRRELINNVVKDTTKGRKLEELLLNAAPRRKLKELMHKYPKAE